MWIASPVIASKASIAQYLATATLTPAAALTTSQPFTLDPELNDAGVTFTVFKINPTDTASDATSLLADFQVNDVSKFAFRKDGLLTAVSFTATGNIQSKSNDPSIGIHFGTSADLSLYRGGANILEQRSGTNSQEFRIFDTYVSATDRHNLAIKTARATLSGVTGASVTATGLIPAGAKLIGVTSKVTTGLGVTNGTTGYAVGTGADPNLWGDVVGTAAGTSSAGVDATADPEGVWSASARDVIVTAATGNFDGTGVIYLAAFYEIVQAD